MDSDLVTFNFQRTGQPTWNFGPRTLDGFNPPTIANLSNWGVVYRNEVTISNPTGSNRTVDCALSRQLALRKNCTSHTLIQVARNLGSRAC